MSTATGSNTPEASAKVGHSVSPPEPVSRPSKEGRGTPATKARRHAKLCLATQ
jgi:hypothetical protein